MGWSDDPGNRITGPARSARASRRVPLRRLNPAERDTIAASAGRSARKINRRARASRHHVVMAAGLDYTPASFG